ncbi:ubiquinol-cytochrome C chaperone family protein [Polycladidibacter stylochi]|uniref:ubiquinol-cytochrome C chaperone family protein n=1 Tax=Polycladidibacter stylochi TaxID=1807766 RepID=UPI00082B649C|nr:ubiquinol-cytochrome C chaperone family protein [Pseudovibrio stylochi]
MVFGFFKKKQRDGVYSLYKTIVQQARQPMFYTEGGVSDSISGRFELIVLHSFLVLKRLDGEGAAAKEVSQGVFDLFFEDMDQSMREQGIGDEGVRRRIRKMSESFYGRSVAYAEAMKSEVNDELVRALCKNIYDSQEKHRKASQLALYVRKSYGYLEKQDLGALLVGHVDWLQELPVVEGA